MRKKLYLVSMIVLLGIFLLPILLTAESFAAQKFQVLIYKDSGYQGDWAPVRCECGQYNADLNRCELLKYEAFAPVGGINWYNAKLACSNLGGHLVTISSEEENQRVTELQVAVGGNGIWIGLTDAAREGSWVWITGEPVTYTNWWKGQPDDCWGIEDCAHIEPVGEIFCIWRWNDLNCGATARLSGYPFGYVCEYDVPGDPCPEGYTYVREGTRGLCVY
ncbi:MAG: C-type lectin domain-containing protein [Deltaproteobacteria bacterium]|nr:C-type lectin domain-containing protein [Deltaproteobacteria bacterium]MBW2085069.1 C-type lectin domain-containing protein [Deltaproteobacteria bacterium]